jgi:hypothetical protein
MVDFPGRVTVQGLFERDPALKAGECRPHAEVDAISEGDVLIEPPVNVETVRL